MARRLGRSGPGSGAERLSAGGAPPGRRRRGQGPRCENAGLRAQSRRRPFARGRGNRGAARAAVLGGPAGRGRLGSRHLDHARRPARQSAGLVGRRPVADSAAARAGHARGAVVGDAHGAPPLEPRRQGAVRRRDLRRPVASGPGARVRAGPRPVRRERRLGAGGAGGPGAAADGRRGTTAASRRAPCGSSRGASRPAPGARPCRGAGSQPRAGAGRPRRARGRRRSRVGVPRGRGVRRRRGAGALRVAPLASGGRPLSPSGRALPASIPGARPPGAPARGGIRPLRRGARGRARDGPAGPRRPRARLERPVSRPRGADGPDRRVARDRSERGPPLGPRGLDRRRDRRDFGRHPRRPAARHAVAGLSLPRRRRSRSSPTRRGAGRSPRFRRAARSVRFVWRPA